MLLDNNLPFSKLVITMFVPPMIEVQNQTRKDVFKI